MIPTCRICAGIAIAQAVISLGACSEEPTDFGVQYRESGAKSLDATATNEGSEQNNGEKTSEGEEQSSHKTPRVIRDGIDEVPRELSEASVEHLLRGSVRSTFQAGSLSATEMILDLDSMLSEQRIVMTGSTADDIKNFKQVERPSHFDSFQQGFSGIKEDTFVQTEDTGGVLDVMLVIDNSGSMAEEQRNLSTKLDPLLSYVASSDWRIAVNTTDPNNGCVTHLIKKGDSNISQKFSQAISAGTSGSGNERGILQARSGLEAACLNTPWTRANSTVAVLIVSDEDNCSNNGSGCSNLAYGKIDYLLDYLNNIRVAGTNARVYGIISHPSKPCASAANVGTQYADIIQKTSGTWGDICDSDYSTTLSSISKNIATVLKSQFALSHTPDSGTLEVYVNDMRQQSGYTLTQNIVEFASAPAAGSAIKFRYRHSSAYFQSFQLSNAAAAETISAEINGVSTAAFSYNSQNRKVLFDTAPAESSSIVIRYRGNVALNTRFSIGTNVIANSIRVFVEGNSQSNGTSYDSSLGDLVFAQAPRDGAAIEVEFDRVATPQLSYSLSQSDFSNLQVVDSVTRRYVTYGVNNGTINFPNSEYRFGRHISIITNADSIGQGTFELPYSPSTGSVVITSGRSRCDEQNGLQIRGKTIIVDTCNFSGAENVVRVAYAYWTRNPSPYSIDAENLDQNADYQIWKVWIDGVAASHFEIKENKVFIRDDEVPSTAEIVVEIEFLRAP